MANVSSSNTTTLYSTTQETIIQPGAAVATGQVNDANFTTLYTSGQQVNPNANLVVDGTLTVNGCAILTNCTAFNLLPTTATSINFGNEATALSIGSGSGTTLINNQLATANYSFPVADGLAGQVLVTNGSGALSFATASSVGKNYDITASSTTGGANFNLNSNVPTTDTIKFSNGTGVTVSQVNASEISFAIGQDVATTATPTFGTTTLNGSLKLNGSSSGYSQFSAPATGANISYVLPNTQGAANTTLVNDGSGNLVWAVYNPFDQSLNTTDSVQFTDLTVGGGPGNYFQTQLGVSVTLNIDNIQIGDGTSNSQGFSINGGVGHSAYLYFDPATDSFVFNADVGGNRLLLNPADADFKTPIKISGSSSGSSTFAAPATGSTLSYVLPGTAGAANTVLTNDGAGNLTWALPGGGGSTFGNITVGVVTDNTISTTTGDLVIDSATNAVSVDANLTVTGDIAANGCDITTTCTTFNLLNTTATTVNAFGAATTTNIGATNGTVNFVGNTLVVDSDANSAASQITFKNTTDTGYLQYGAIGGYATFELSDRLVIAETVNALLSTVVPVLDLRAVNSAGVPTVGFGPSLSFNSEYPSVGYSTVGFINTRITDATPGAVDFEMNIGLTKDSAFPDVKLTINSEGDVSIDGNLTINMDQTAGTSYLYAYSGATLGNISWDGTRWTASNNLTTNGALRINGSSSGYSEFSAAATGANISYVLPSAQGAASTVLTNDGSGNLTWALPGGGGSTFGNVSIGVVTDNTISTTTGDLDITSTTGVINLDNYTAFTDNRLTTTSTSTVTLDSLAIATYQSASYTVTIKNTVTGATQFTKIDLLHDGSVAYIDQYSNMASLADLATFSATISGANAVLQITPASANSTQFTFNRIATKV